MQVQYTNAFPLTGGESSITCTNPWTGEEIVYEYDDTNPFTISDAEWVTERILNHRIMGQNLFEEVV